MSPRKRERRTPLRSSLEPGSPLRAGVRDGIGALAKAHRKCLSEDVRQAFADSLDVDEALRAGHEHESRWDYLLGRSKSRELVGIEPHAARSDEVDTVIRKKKAAREQLAKHLVRGARVTTWIWVASGRVQIPHTDKLRYRLDQHGITFAGRVVLSRHLPGGGQPRGETIRPRRWTIPAR